MKKLDPKQKVFNKVWRHFVTNKGEPSINSDRDCCYRGPHGTKCAVGLLIPDRLYDPCIEGSGVRLLWRFSRQLSTHIDNLDVDMMFLEQLQRAHDNAASARPSRPFFTRRICKILGEVAKDYDLEIPKVSR